MRKRVLLSAVLFSVSGFSHNGSEIEPFIFENEFSISREWLESEKISEFLNYFVYDVDFDPEDFPFGGWVCGICGRLNRNSNTKCLNGCDDK